MLISDKIYLLFQPLILWCCITAADYSTSLHDWTFEKEKHLEENYAEKEAAVCK